MSLSVVVLVVWVVQRQPRDFTVSFWSNFLSSAIVVILFGTFIDQFTELTKKPLLKMVVKQEKVYSDKITFTKAKDGNYEASFRIAINNYGSKMLKPGEGYWHFYLPGVSEVSPDKEAGRFLSSDKDHLRELINLPLFPKSFLDIGPEFRIKVIKDNVNSFKAYYFFETNYGYFPRTVVLDSKSGLVEYKKMTEIEVKFSS